LDLQRALEKREMAARLRQLAPGLSLVADRESLLRDAASLEAEAARLEGTPKLKPGPLPTELPVEHRQEQVQQQAGQSDEPRKLPETGRSSSALEAADRAIEEAANCGRSGGFIGSRRPEEKFKLT